MNSEGIAILKPVRKMILLIVFSIFAIVICFSAIILQWDSRANTDKVMINVFGRQRALTQEIAKDASRLYALRQSLEFNTNYQSKEIVNNKINACISNLKQASSDFSNTLSAMHSGYLEHGNTTIDIRSSTKKIDRYLTQVDTIWVKFNQSINTITTSTKINSGIAEATIYINDNNMQLMLLCDNITQTVTDDSIQFTKNLSYITAGLVALLLTMIIVLLYHLSKYIITPFSELYRGLSDIGLSDTSKPSKKQSKRSLAKQDFVPVVRQISEAFAKINHLISLIESMNNSSSFVESVDFINRTFSDYIPYEYIGIALIDKNKNILKAAYGVSNGKVDGLPEKLVGKQAYLQDTSLGKVIECGEARIINDLEEYVAGKPLKEYNRIILEAGIRSSITLPLKVSDEPVGVIFFSSTSKNVYATEHINFLKTLVNSMAISFDKNILIGDLLLSSILALAKLAEARDEDTGEHLDRMKTYARMIAESLQQESEYREQITPQYIEDLENFSPLHDIGKVGIRDGILLKPAKLTFDEFEEMKKHALYGADVLRAANANMGKKDQHLFDLGVEIAEGHHEKWNGSGYPYGKSGTEIPLSARIVAVADVFDALTSKRPYKEPFPFEESINIIVEGSGTHFDPEVVGAFLKIKDSVYRQYKRFHGMN